MFKNGSFSLDSSSEKPKGNAMLSIGDTVDVSSFGLVSTLTAADEKK
jgi:hypothetical protein